MSLSDGIEVISVKRDEGRLNEKGLNNYAEQAKITLQEQRFEELKKMCLGVLGRRWNKFVQRVLESTV